MGVRQNERANGDTSAVFVLDIRRLMIVSYDSYGRMAVSANRSPRKALVHVILNYSMLLQVAAPGVACILSTATCLASLSNGIL